MLASRHVKKLNLNINDKFVPHFRIKLSVADPGEVWAPLIFRPNWGLKGQKIFLDSALPLSQGQDDLAPSYLKVWIYRIHHS